MNQEPGPYLGLPTLWGRSKVLALAYVKERIQRKISGWHQSTLSSAAFVQSAIVATSFGLNSDSDILIWSALSSVTQDTWDWIWKLRVAPKIKHFVWRAISNILATNGNRFARHIALSPTCVICGEFDESVEHALFPCPWATVAWFVHPLSYKESPPNLRTTVHAVITSNSLPNLKWGRPSLDSIKINTNATWDSTALSSGLAAIARNSSGIIVGGLASQTLATSVVAAEAQALLLGLSLATSLSLSSFTLESDSRTLISALSNPLSSVDWSASNHLKKIRLLSCQFNRVNWSWISRLANSVADHVANLAKCGVCIGDWYSSPSLSLMHILLYDAQTDPP
ncbi:hypothetical protein ACLB2K_026059 [Fragaria x ananassa]